MSSRGSSNILIALPPPPVPASLARVKIRDMKSCSAMWVRSLCISPVKLPRTNAIVNVSAIAFLLWCEHRSQAVNIEIINIPLLGENLNHRPHLVQQLRRHEGVEVSRSKHTSQHGHNV